MHHGQNDGSAPRMRTDAMAQLRDDAQRVTACVRCLGVLLGGRSSTSNDPEGSDLEYLIQLVAEQAELVADGIAEEVRYARDRIAAHG